MLATGGSDETGWKPGLFKAQLCSGGMPDGPCLAKVDAVRSGPKEIKFPKRTILVNINTLYSISYNAFFEKNKTKKKQEGNKALNRSP